MESIVTFIETNIHNLITKTEGIIISIFLVFFLFLIWLFLPYCDINIINSISVIGTSATLIGFYITFRQIQSVKETTDKIDLAVKNKLSDFNKLLLLSDVSSKIALIHEIKAHLRKEQFEVVIIRMEDLKKMMATIIPNASFLSISVNLRDLDTNLKNLRMNMDTIEKKILDSSYQIATDKVIANMDKMSTYLLSLEILLKQN